MLPRQPLCCLPTPVHRLDRLSAELGIDLWIKRDDLTGFAAGGNKGRKLEYLLPAIQAEGATAVVACGSTQSNFIRQLGVACSVIGIRCVAVTMATPYPDGGERPILAKSLAGGNRVINDLAGVEVTEIPDGGWTELELAAKAQAETLRRTGETVYEVPIGGSTGLGAYGFLMAGQELSGQLDGVDAVVTASSSGSTQTGLTAWFAPLGVRVVGISADPEPEIADEMAALSEDLARVSGEPLARQAEDFEFRLDYVGPGYSIPSEAGEAAMRRLLKTEGILLDPVYSAKAFAGLLDLVEQGDVTGRVVFWHTGGTPAAFTY